MNPKTSSKDTAAEPLLLVRLPGSFGPVLRCEGRLDDITAGHLREAVALLAPMGHRAVILNLSGIREFDLGGLGGLVDACCILVRERVRPVLVVGTGRAARLAVRLRLNRALLVARSEEDALNELEFLYGEHAWPQRSWSDARRTSLARWRRLDRDLDRLPAADVARRVTEMHALCQKSEDLVVLDESPNRQEGAARCEVCPLFHELGGQPRDLGCDSATGPLVQALARGDVDRARAGIRRMIHLLEGMPCPPDGESPSPAGPWSRFERQLQALVQNYRGSAPAEMVP